ncbi:MAG: MotA/TolQ/ExbB proton channel family protein [Candidatus Delongbacteria bacterium]|jgi:biopolymer transport protein ExbB|nr:MotA/TolQ/ExbB proton channel family protein [Candidatus Delongbacteria bacterium]MDD4205541.1 MotA/TolQ/ExbB proton channel family protein [Candidatus Delongbacteria bacterium]MDY0017906.1 MotA/TolQ/ExbB proton channel family protein [Candidatus Delongbacteria bacterium]
MTEYFVKGGAFMWPILILFIIGIIISLYKLFTLLGTGRNAGQLMSDVKKALATQGVDGAMKHVKGTKPVEELVAAGLKNLKYGIDNVEKALVNEGSMQVTYLWSGMIWLSTVVALAPMLGFLGTVWGMVGAMDAIAAANDISPSIVAGGISEALLTTAFGLIVAIIIQTFQNVFQSIIDKRQMDMEETSVALVETFVEMQTK